MAPPDRQPEALPQRLYTLGPAGTFSDRASRLLLAHLNALSVAVQYTRTIPEVLARSEAEERAWGVAPIENSDVGAVLQTQDHLVRHRLTILWEVNLRLRYGLVAQGPLLAVHTLYAHPVGYEQCSEFVAAHLPQAQVSFTASNVDSGQRLLEAAPGSAAIVPQELADQYAAVRADLTIRADIQNFAHNTTRFLALRRAAEPEQYDFSRRKTALYVEPKEDRPGLLYGLLSIFNSHQLNLCRLESRPDRIKPWNYVFFIDFNNNAGSARCLEELRQTGHRITVLGSFDTLE